MSSAQQNLPTPPPLTPTERQALFTMTDEGLLRQCRTDVFRGTGPGGQKRNRTESAVRLTHSRTGVTAGCDETRSQHLNRQLALRKLRHELALRCRCLPALPYAGSWAPGPKSVDYPGWVAAVLDHLEEQQFRLSEAGAKLGVSTGRLVRDLAAADALWQIVNAGRQRYGHPALRHP
jgi:hypothetical protein